jgi:hypothetical protein
MFDAICRCSSHASVARTVAGYLIISDRFTEILLAPTVIADGSMPGEWVVIELLSGAILTVVTSCGCDAALAFVKL